MPDLANWDDLIHGTLVFAAALPFAVALGVGLRFPHRLGLAAALAVAGPFLWFFGIPSAPLSSDDALVSALLVGALLVFVPLRLPVRFLAGLVLWGTLAWFFYPAWLAADGGISRRLLVVVGMAVFISAVGLASVCLAGSTHRLSPTAFLPLAIALAVLLVTGGASQFAQSSGAIAATLAAVGIVTLRKPKNAGLPAATALGAMLLALLAWSGWLFAEIRPAMAALLFLSPAVAFAARFLPLPRQRPILVLLWDGLAATLAVAPLLTLVLIDYTASGLGDSEGY